MQLGISSYTFNWWAGVPGYPAPARRLTPERLLEEAERLGVRLAQIADNLPLDRLDAERLEALAGAARARGIAIETGMGAVDAAGLRAYLEISQRLGARLLRALAGVDGKESVARLREAAPELERAGIVLALENHDRLPARSLRAIVEEVGSRAVGVCLDTANSLGCGEDLRTVLAELEPYVVNLHLKDFRVARLPHRKGFAVTGAPAGRGLLDIPALLERFRGRGVNCILELWSEPLATVEESAGREREWAEESLRYVQGVLNLPGGR